MDLIDLFRAPDDAAVRAILPGTSPRDVFDTLPDSTVDVLDLLEELLAADPDAELTTTVWPTVPWRGCLVLPDDPWHNGPVTYRLHPAVRDSLAITPMPTLLALRPYHVDPPAAALELLPLLADLARRAAAAGDSLYYWFTRALTP